MKTLGLIIKILTFPGTFLHAYWEHIMCKTYDCPVDDRRYFRMNEMCGHVDHDFFPTAGQQFAFCFFPMLFNGLLGIAVGLPAVINIVFLGTGAWYHYLMLWLGISLAANAFPLIEDAMALWEMVYGGEKSLVQKILAFPLCAIMYAGAYLSAWGLTVITAGVALRFIPLIAVLFA